MSVRSKKSALRRRNKKQMTAVYRSPASPSAALCFNDVSLQGNDQPFYDSYKDDPITKGTEFSSWDEVGQAVGEYNQRLGLSFFHTGLYEIRWQSDGTDKAIGHEHSRIRLTFTCHFHHAFSTACPAMIQFDLYEEGRIVLTSLDLRHIHQQSRTDTDQTLPMNVSDRSQGFEPVTSSDDEVRPTTGDDKVMITSRESNEATVSGLRNQGHISSGEMEVNGDSDFTASEGGTTPNKNSDINQASADQNVDVEVFRDSILNIINEVASDLKTVGQNQAALKEISQSIDLKVSKISDFMKQFCEIVADPMESKSTKTGPIPTAVEQKPQSKDQKLGLTSLPSPSAPPLTQQAPASKAQTIPNKQAPTSKTQTTQTQHAQTSMAQAIPEQQASTPKAQTIPEQQASTSKAQTTPTQQASTSKAQTTPEQQTSTSKAQTTPTQQASTSKAQTTPKQQAPTSMAQTIPEQQAQTPKTQNTLTKQAPTSEAQTIPKQQAPTSKTQTTPTQHVQTSKTQTMTTQQTQAPMEQTIPTQQSPPPTATIQQLSEQPTTAADLANTLSTSASAEDSDGLSSVDAALYLRSIDPGLKAIAQLNLEKRLNGQFRGSKFEVLGINQVVTKGLASRMKEYDLLFSFSDFMDPDSGIFTIPASGRYRFEVTYKQLRHGKGRVYLARDDGECHMMGKFPEDGDGGSTAVEWNCDQGSYVWVEALRLAGGGVKLKWLKFRGEHLG